jgi:hypothetical protein
MNKNNKNAVSYALQGNKISGMNMNNKNAVSYAL